MNLMILIRLMDESVRVTALCPNTDSQLGLTHVVILAAHRSLSIFFPEMKLTGILPFCTNVIW